MNVPVRSLATSTSARGRGRVHPIRVLFDLLVRQLPAWRGPAVTPVRVHQGTPEETQRRVTGVLRGPRCDACDRDMDPDSMHHAHDTTCTRFMDGWCRCDGLWVCPDCCPDTDCVTPLAARLRAAHEEYVASIGDAG